MLPYLCRSHTTVCLSACTDVSFKISACFIYVKSTLRYVFKSNKNVHIRLKNSVRIRLEDHVHRKLFIRAWHAHCKQLDAVFRKQFTRRAGLEPVL